MWVEPLERRALCSASTFYISPTGNDAADGLTPATAWRHVQRAFDAAHAGSTVNVLAGRYREHLTLNVSGSAEAGYTTFQAVGHVVLDGGGVTDTPIVAIAKASYVKLVGFDVANYTTKHGGAAILFEGTGDHVQLLNNAVHHTRGHQATAIGIYGTDPVTPISNVTIDGNGIYDCRPADSETVTLNGNVTGFAVTNNIIRDTNNIGIDFIGGEGTSPDPATDVARDGLCAGNHVFRAHSSYGKGYGAGIYVDGGRDIVIERNTVDNSDLGIEVGCEHAGVTTTGVTVRDNLLYANNRAGLAFGGYAATVGRVSNCTFVNNTLYHNQTKPDGNGEVWIQLANNCVLKNNLIVAGRQGVATSADTDGGVTGTGNTSDHNLFFSDAKKGKTAFGWMGETYRSTAEYKSATGQDGQSVFADPKLVKPNGGDVRLNAASPAIDAGDGTVDAGTTDLRGNARTVGSSIDIGAVESAGG